MKGPTGIYIFDGRGRCCVLEVIWKAVSDWYYEGMTEHPAAFLLPVHFWMRACWEVSPGQQNSLWDSLYLGVGFEDLPNGEKRYALSMKAPIGSRWLFFAEPMQKQVVRVMDAEWKHLGGIEIE